MRPQTHKKIHSPEKPFRCPMCGLDFKSKGSLKPHISIKHENRPKHKCPLRMVGVCKKDFTTIGNMKVSIVHLMQTYSSWLLTMTCPAAEPH